MAGYYLLIFFLRGLASYCLVIKVDTISHEDSHCWEIFAAFDLSLSAGTTELRSFSGLQPIYCGNEEPLNKKVKYF